MLYFGTRGPGSPQEVSPVLKMRGCSQQADETKRFPLFKTTTHVNTSCLLVLVIFYGAVDEGSHLRFLEQTDTFSLAAIFDLYT